MTEKIFPVNIAMQYSLERLLLHFVQTRNCLEFYHPWQWQWQCIDRLFTRIGSVLLTLGGQCMVHNARKETNYRRINQKTMNTWKHTNILHTETYWKKTLDTKHTLHRQQLTVKRKSTLQFADKVQWVNCKFHNCWWKDDLETTLPMGHYNGRPRSQRLVITIIIALAG